MARTRTPVAVVVVVISAALAHPLRAQDGVPPAMADYPDFRQIVQDAKEKVFPAVIYIKCVRETTESGKKESQEVSGSGVIVSPEGEALTNWHVIEKATSVRCLLSDGRHFDAEVLGSDQDTDLAVLRLALPEGETLPHATLGDSTDLKEGDFVMAMGAPWGLNRSVSIGIVSCTTRFLEGVSEYSLWVQTDAAINPGNSGGPLVNTAGEIVGLNARGMGGWAEGMGFAIPSEAISILLPQLRDHGDVSWSWTGLQLQPLRDFNRNMYFPFTDGVIVAETDPDSPARRAGVRPRDRVVRVNGHTTTAVTTEDLPRLRRWLGLLPKNEDAEFEIARGGEVLRLMIQPREKGEVKGEELALERFDLSIKAINQFENPELHFHRPTGVWVYAVKWPGNASSSGLRQGDIILKIDGREVQTIDDVKQLHAALVENVATRHRVLVVVLRNGLMHQIVLDFARDYSKD